MQKINRMNKRNGCGRQYYPHATHCFDSRCGGAMVRNQTLEFNLACPQAYGDCHHPLWSISTALTYAH